MARLIVYMRFKHKEEGHTYSGNFTYRCKTIGQCEWCCVQEVREFIRAGWELISYKIKEGKDGRISGI